MDTIADIRIEALRSQRKGFVKRHPSAVLLQRQTVQGDLHFADPGKWEEAPHEGSTMIHVPRVTISERLRGSDIPGRKPLVQELWASLELAPGKEFLTIGRNRDTDICLDGYSVSALHAKFLGVPSTVRGWIEDQDSRNGTFHNGVHLIGGQRSELLTGDEIVIGRFALLFLDPSDFHRYLTGDW